MQRSAEPVIRQRTGTRVARTTSFPVDRSSASMIDMRRRRSIAATGLAPAALFGAPALLGRARPRVVVVGGGAGGATAAWRLAAGGGLDVTLVEDSPRYTSCFFSNLYLGGLRDFDSITHGYGAFAAGGAPTLVTDRATHIDRAAGRLSLAGGGTLPYERLLLSPGIELIHDSVPGYSAAAAEIAPHAWTGGAQTERLRDKLHALENGQDIVVLAPPNPYRCPPGPYERVSMMAHVLASKGFTDSAITILDAKPSFSKQALFTEAWSRHYPGMIEWLPPEIHGGVIGVDAAAGTVETDFGTFAGALLNVIPSQRAAAVAAPFRDASGFCPIEADTMRSTLDEAVFVVGDASIAGAMPKSAFAASSQAQVAAGAIRADLLGGERRATRYANTCWSLLAPEDCVRVGAVYAPKEGVITSTTSFVSQPGESAETRSATYRQSLGWYASITAAMFDA